MKACTSSSSVFTWYSFSMLSAAGLSRLIAFATPPTARFWMFGVFEPRTATTWLALRWTSSAWR